MGVHLKRGGLMTSTPDEVADSDGPDGPNADPPGAEIGITQGEGSTFEPEEDPDGES